MAKKWFFWPSKSSSPSFFFLCCVCERGHTFFLAQSLSRVLFCLRLILRVFFSLTPQYLSAFTNDSPAFSFAIRFLIRVAVGKKPSWYRLEETRKIRFLSVFRPSLFLFVRLGSLVAYGDGRSQAGGDHASAHGSAPWFGVLHRFQSILGCVESLSPSFLILLLFSFSGFNGVC